MQASIFKQQHYGFSNGPKDGVHSTGTSAGQDAGSQHIDCNKCVHQRVCVYLVAVGVRCPSHCVLHVASWILGATGLLSGWGGWPSPGLEEGCVHSWACGTSRPDMLASGKEGFGFWVELGMCCTCSLLVFGVQGCAWFSLQGV